MAWNPAPQPKLSSLTEESGIRSSWNHNYLQGFPYLLLYSLLVWMGFLFFLPAGSASFQSLHPKGRSLALFSLQSPFILSLVSK